MIGPEVTHGLEVLPPWRYHLAVLIYRTLGWDVKVHAPPDPKMVMMAAPHTSNWDAFYMLVACSVYRVRLRFLFKDTMAWPIKPLLVAFGGVPIDRSGGKGLVEAAAEQIRNADRMLLVVAPSGTRKRTERWKSGFYHIARAADVPLVCGILDYGRKEAAFGPKIVLTGDVKTDMDAIRAAYAGKTGMRPDQMTPIRIKEEAEEEAG